MITSLQLALISVVSQEQLDGIRNVLSKSVRAVNRMTNGHETLLVVIFIMLILMYLYIRKA